MLMPSMFADDLFDEFMRDFPFYDDRDERKAEKKPVSYTHLHRRSWPCLPPR